MTRGWPLFVLVCALVAGLYAAPDPALKWAALVGLGFLYVLTAIPSKAGK